MFVAALLANVLLASTVLARPSLKQRNERRKNGALHSRPKNPVRTADGSVKRPDGNKNAEYSDNWSGAVYDSASGTYTGVSATFIVPKPSAGAGLSSSASAWVGIDGDTCGNAILQTGVDFNYDLGVVTYDAWYEWYPDYAYDFSGISFSAGDEVSLSVTATTAFTGTAVIENLSTGAKVTKALISLFSLCKENAEWIVEDFEEGSSLVPFADFGTVTFSNAIATTSTGLVGPELATIIDIEQSGVVLTSVSTGLTSVTVKYV